VLQRRVKGGPNLNHRVSSTPQGEDKQKGVKFKYCQISGCYRLNST
jgi:hypothetical protein